MEKQIITAIILVPCASATSNAFNILNMIAEQIGRLNCEIEDDTAIIRYYNKLSRKAKDILNNIADKNCYKVLYIEAYEDDERITEDTISLL